MPIPDAVSAGYFRIVSVYLEVLLNFGNAIFDVWQWLLESELSLRTYFYFAESKGREEYYNFLHVIPGNSK